MAFRYSGMVRHSSANAFRRVILPFFCGRKPSKQNFSFGSPEATNAGTKAVAPGKHCTSMPLRTHSLTTRKPGSDIPGVPASEIKATVSPPFILLTTLSTDKYGKTLCSAYPGREFGRYDIPCYPDSERSGFDTC